MAEFQVVAVYPSGRRYPVREAHDTFVRANSHRVWCERDADPRDTWTYQVDCTYTGPDGQTHWRSNITGEDLGYSPEELEPAWMINPPGAEVRCVDCGQVLPELLAFAAALRCADCRDALEEVA